jgi:hypothetical protein
LLLEPARARNWYSPVSRACLDSFGSSTCGCDDAAVRCPVAPPPRPRGSEEGSLALSTWAYPPREGRTTREN